ncbi:Predicted thiol-disulfide oxidoreductase YuxK, DCC family [Saccharicrinis carchari]|uniref:Predicted thiol-disulfide oxidoreductase YuxK, DCC family n=1 Tax=Saccharicrinis carchari TaxID=1168039 RepID=A0A521DFX1_SACCC|nr:DUF393 domain-containing protein [Saccharicrinis carchari]SMO70518.1 Predicted thiol-disulfide oxidoreductase YuxK, DCC family [Saccharicrinis carchari]
MNNKNNEPILLYDGECGLCSFAVQFILRYEKDKRLKFATLQSDWAKGILQNSADAPPNLDSVVLLQNNSIYIKSRALTRLTPYLKFPFNLLAIFKIIPPFVADPLYDWVARNRQRFFKPRCVIISKEQEGRFVG